MIKIRNDELGDLIICAFRYALGRKTYITNTIAELIIKYKDELSTSDTEVIKRDIKRAFDMNNYGMEMDKKEWQRVLEALE